MAAVTGSRAVLLRQVLQIARTGRPALPKALDIAHCQPPSPGATGGDDLSRLWQQQNKRAEARDLLTPIYGWFTEGFDTANLQEAKALLDELEG